MLHATNIRTGTVVEPATVAQVFARSRVDGDAIGAVYDYYLRNVRDEIIALGEFPPWNSLAAERFLFGHLGINPAYAGGTCCIPRAVFHVKMIEVISGRYCTTYVMRAPFTGEFHDCPGGISGDIGYRERTIRWPDAGRFICRHLAADPGKDCRSDRIDSTFTLVDRSSDGSLIYVVGLRIGERITIDTAMPHQLAPEFRYLVYRLDAVLGLAELVVASTHPVNPRDFMRK